MRFLLGLFIAAFLLSACNSPGVLEDAQETLGDTLCNNPDSTQTGNSDNSTHPSDTISAPLSVGEALALYDAYTAQSVTVTGYIIGAVKGTYITGATFEAPFTIDSNILIADSVQATATGLFLPVQLNKGSKARQQLSLADNPHLLGTKVTISGKLEKYFRVAGIKSVTAFSTE